MFNYSQSGLKNYLFREYFEDTSEYLNFTDLKTKINMLIDNNLAASIQGNIDAWYDPFTLLHFICYKMIKWNKKLKSFVNKAGYNESEESKASVGNIKLDKKYTNILYNGSYLALINKKTDEFALLTINEEADGMLNFSLYIIGKKCLIRKNDLLNEYKEILAQYKENNIKNYLVVDYNLSNMKESIFKSFDEMVFHDKDKILKYIENWYINIPTYYKYNIMPKLSILLYGEPGTGKSTFAKALAKYFKLSSVCMITPDFFSTNTNINRRSPVYTSCVISIDDIDCFSKNREKDDSLENGKIVSSMLEFLDNPPNTNIKAADGNYYQVAIVCATTNYYEKLDPAIKRFGRFDLKIEMKNFDVDLANEMCKLYDLSLDDVYTEKYNKDTLFSPAQIQALCIENIDKKLKK